MTGVRTTDNVARPNIVIILADDLGYSDLGCYGGEARTPHLDRLAAAGVRFTDFHCTPRCCPSRAALLTGLTPHKAGVGWMTFDWAHHLDPEADGYVGTLNDRCATIPEVLRDGGYRSYMSGKWHVTSKLTDRSTWPCGRGFDRSFALISGTADYFAPRRLVLDERYYLPPRRTYFTDLIGRYAERFVDGHFHGHRDQPMLLYLAFTAPHAPIQAPEAFVDPYRAVYSPGWDVLREERFERMKALGVAEAEWTLPPRPTAVPAWETLPGEDKRRQSNTMATYAAMIESMDENIGKVVSALERNDALENTLILFLSDNGACAEGPTMGSETHYGECWAHLSNAPFRLYKHFTTQGGVQTPMIASWPAGIAVETNDASTVTASLYDIMPTCLDLAGVAYPEQRNGIRLHSLDGASMAPVLRGQPRHQDVSIFVEHEGNEMLRSGRYKIVRQHHESFWQLYDMKTDRTEMVDLSSGQQPLFTEMAKRYEQWVRTARVLPWTRVGRYREFHGYQGPSRDYTRVFDEALDNAPDEQVVKGDDIGDGEP